MRQIGNVPNCPLSVILSYTLLPVYWLNPLAPARISGETKE